MALETLQIQERITQKFGMNAQNFDTQKATTRPL